MRVGVRELKAHLSACLDRAAAGETIVVTGPGIGSSRSTGVICERAPLLAESTGARTIDTLHRGAAQATVGGEAPLVTIDRGLADAARSPGRSVLGA